ncbi:hypothetical protein [Draconibacterium sediminis]|uniref:NERD domain-containing protein n=1 Tax=Draconibacterium sediminis TaxID=1544798 RepID=A0A0D8JC41_9BACT|nr:hypothetical protein [Draconibacterium sediminis]KJF44279.1 hypothetical protein LH29_01830 [Draconibacterium sediminis]
MQLVLENIILYGLILFLIVIVAKYYISEKWKKRKQKSRFERGIVMEEKAKTLLQKRGYKVVNSQQQFVHNFEVNGKPFKSDLKVDYIAKKNGKTYIVEVKSGTSAIDIRNRNTRRQLLEYDFVIESDGIVLLDMENQKLQHIQFFSKSERGEVFLIKSILVVSLLAIIIPYWKVKLFIILILGVIWFFHNKVGNIINTILKPGQHV